MDINIVKRFIYGAKEAYKKADNHSYNFPITIESAYRLATNIETLLKEQGTEWEHLWDAPDGTFKGRCKKCGFVKFFIEVHDTQYKFCPECGRLVK